MDDELFEGYDRMARLFYLVLLAVLLLGAAAGAFYLVRRYGSSEEVKAYLGEVAAGLSGGTDAKKVTAGAIKTGLLSAALFFVCGFFRPGAAVIAAETARRGFVAGFTSAAFIRYFGAKGLLLSACMLPSAAVLIPAVLMFGSVNAAAAFGRERRSKKFWAAYIFFFAAFCAIFCISAIFEGFLTTIYMKYAASWVT